jgi:hypothetical protein
VTITLAPRDRGITDVTLHHSSLPAELRRTHKEGWAWFLDALAERFDKVAGR